MAFLNISDYTATISAEHLQQIITDEANPDGEAIIDRAEERAFDKVKSYLRGKFDLALLFLFIHDYRAGVTYNEGEYVWHADGVLYVALQAVKDITPADLNGDLYWAKKEPRKLLLVEILVAVALYNVHKRISPQNIPELRRKDYEEALKMLEKIADGQLDADFPKIADATTKPAFRSDIKQNWHF